MTKDAHRLEAQKDMKTEGKRKKLFENHSGIAYDEVKINGKKKQK